MSKLGKIDHNKVMQGLLKSESRRRFENFRDYTFELECKFETDRKKLLDRYKESIKGLTEDQISEMNDYFSDDFYEIDDIYIVMYRKSTLVSIYSFIESQMNDFCRYLQKKNQYKIELCDLKGEGIVRAKDYLEKVAGIDLTHLNGGWSYLKQINRIRNCIVHTEGDIEEDNNKDKIENIIKSSKGKLSLKHDRYIIVSREYINESIDKSEEFINDVFKEIFK